jgi:hypothetical protein
MTNEKEKVVQIKVIPDKSRGEKTVPVKFVEPEPEAVETLPLKPSSNAEPTAYGNFR